MATATYLGQDATTRGNWPGVYGSAGAAIATNGNSFGGLYSFAVTGTDGVHGAAGTDDRAPWNLAGTARIATFYGGSPVKFSLTLPTTFKLSIYLLDWFGGARIHQAKVIDRGTATTLDTQSGIPTTSFYGLYVSWIVSGNIDVEVIATNNAVPRVSAIFLDPYGAPGTPAQLLTLGSAGVGFTIS